MQSMQQMLYLLLCCQHWRIRIFIKVTQVLATQTRKIQSCAISIQARQIGCFGWSIGASRTVQGTWSLILRGGAGDEEPMTPIDILDIRSGLICDRVSRIPSRGELYWSMGCKITIIIYSKFRDTNVASSIIIHTKHYVANKCAMGWSIFIQCVVLRHKLSSRSGLQWIIGDINALQSSSDVLGTKETPNIWRLEIIVSVSFTVRLLRVVNLRERNIPRYKYFDLITCKSSILVCRIWLHCLRARLGYNRHR